MTKPFGQNVISAHAVVDFNNVASDAFDGGKTLPQMLVEACARNADAIHAGGAFLHPCNKYSRLGWHLKPAPAPSGPM